MKNDNSKVVIQNVIDIEAVDDSLFLALLDCIMKALESQEQHS